jgi:hypothetical protein
MPVLLFMVNTKLITMLLAGAEYIEITVTISLPFHQFSELYLYFSVSAMYKVMPTSYQTRRNIRENALFFRSPNLNT